MHFRQAKGFWSHIAKEFRVWIFPSACDSSFEKTKWRSLETKRKIHTTGSLNRTFFKVLVMNRSDPHRKCKNPPPPLLHSWFLRRVRRKHADSPRSTRWGPPLGSWWADLKWVQASFEPLWFHNARFKTCKDLTNCLNHCGSTTTGCLNHRGSIGHFYSSMFGSFWVRLHQ